MQAAAGTSSADAAASDIVIGTERALGLVTLSRPQALNALSIAMKRRMPPAFKRWSEDPSIYAAMIRSAVPRAFCAGADVRELVGLIEARFDEVRQAQAEEYALLWQLECFTKPTLSLIDGVVMGSGVGISLYGTHRVAGAGYRFAMPEASLGFFPDAGATYFFSHMPDRIGLYLAMTGRSIGRADAYALGLVTHCIDAARFEEIRAGLADADPIDGLLDPRHADPGTDVIGPWRSLIAECFSAPSVAEIVRHLEAEQGAARDFAQATLAQLSRQSPTSLAIVHRQLALGRDLDLKAAFELEYRLSLRVLRGPELREGVRAALIDRDGAPRWQPASIADVDPASIEALFAPLPEGEELVLPARPQSPLAIE